MSVFLFVCVCVCFPCMVLSSWRSSQMSCLSPGSPWGNWHSWLIIKKGRLLVSFDENKIPEKSVRYSVIEQVTCWCLGFGPYPESIEFLAWQLKEPEAPRWTSWTYYNTVCLLWTNSRSLNLIADSRARRSPGLGRVILEHSIVPWAPIQQTHFFFL